MIRMILGIVGACLLIVGICLVQAVLILLFAVLWLPAVPYLVFRYIQDRCLER